MRAQPHRFLLTGGTAIERSQPPKPCEWLGDKQWNEMCRLSLDYPQFKGLHTDFIRSPNAWKHIFDSGAPEKEEYPEPWSGSSGKIPRFGKLMILRTLRPDKTVNAIQVMQHSLDHGECRLDSNRLG